MKRLNKILFVLVTVSTISCNSGGSSGAGSPGGNLPPPQINIDYAKVQQYAVPYTFPSSKTSGYACIKVNNFISAPDQANTSVTGEFDLVNNCETSQSLSGLEFGYVSLNRDLALKPQFFNLEYVNGVHFLPDETDLSLRATSASRSNYLMVNLLTRGYLEAHSQAHFTYSYNNADAVSSYKSLILSVTGQTPVNNSTLNVTLDSSSVSQFCGELNECKMILHVYGQNSNLFESHQIVSGKNGNILYHLTHMNPGQYVVSLSGLPSHVKSMYSNTDKPIQLNSGESANITIKLLPDQVSLGNFKVEVKNPDTQKFPLVAVVAHCQDQFATVDLIHSNSTSGGIVKGVPAGEYMLGVSNVADASTGEYWDYPTEKFKILAGQTVDVGEIKPVRSTQDLVSEDFKVVGLNKGQVVTFVFTDKLGYKYNAETVTEINSEGVMIANYRFPKGDQVTVNIIVSDQNGMNSGNPAPVSFTVTEPQILVFNAAPAR